MNAPVTIPTPDSSLFDTDVELALIGRIISDPEGHAYHDARVYCTPLNFAFEANSHIFELCEVVEAEGETITFVTVLARLGRKIENTLGPQYEGRAYLESAIETALTHRFAGMPIQALARRLSDLSLRRRVDAELDAARLRVAEGKSPIAASLRGVIEVVGEVLDRAAQSRGQQTTEAAADAILKKVEAAMNGQTPPAIRMGISQLDEIIGGFHPGDLAIIAGRPGMGKSVHLTAIALRAALAGYPAIFFSREMPAQQLLERMACDLDYDTLRTGGKPLHYEAFRSGRVSDDEFQRLYTALRDIAALPIRIDETSASMPEIAAISERYAARAGRLGVVVIDYLQLLDPTDRYRGRKVDEVGEVTRTAKSLAKRIGWPVVVGCQLSRATEARDNKRPTLSDLRDSGNIEQDADSVLALYRPAYYLGASRPAHGPSDPGYTSWVADYRAVAHDLEIAVLKNRHGRTGTVLTHCDIGASVIRNRHGEDARPASEEFPL